MALSVAHSPSDSSPFQCKDTWPVGLYENVTGTIYLVRGNAASVLLANTREFARGEHVHADLIYLRPYYGTIQITNTKD